MRDFIRAKNPSGRRFLVSFVVWLFALGCTGPPKRVTWKNATSAEHLERLMWQAVQDKDWDNFERHLSPTFVGVNADGKMFDRTGWLAYWKGVPVSAITVGDLSAQPEGLDIKVTYTFQFQTQGTAASSAAGLRVVSVWQQIKTRWALTATSITPIKGE